VKGILTDVNIDGHLRLVPLLLDEPSRIELWNALKLSLLTFSDLGLSHETTDLQVWQRCQQERLMLLTNNRNDDGPESLAVAVRSANTPTAIPVVTFGDGNRFLNEREYANRAVDKLLEYLFDIDNYRGTGRLYVP
jgi:hypothetical protein